MCHSDPSLSLFLSLSLSLSLMCFFRWYKVILFANACEKKFITKYTIYVCVRKICFFIFFNDWVIYVLQILHMYILALCNHLLLYAIALYDIALYYIRSCHYLHPPVIYRYNFE